MRKFVLGFAMAGAAFLAPLLSPEPLAAGSNVAFDVQPKARQAPELVAINNVRLYRRMTQLGMVSQQLGYTLSIDAEGQVTDCDLSRRFKSRFTTVEICKALARNIEFAPARDAQGKAIESSYKGALDLLTFFRPDR